MSSDWIETLLKKHVNTFFKTSIGDLCHLVPLESNNEITEFLLASLDLLCENEINLIRLFKCVSNVSKGFWKTSGFKKATFTQDSLFFLLLARHVISKSVFGDVTFSPPHPDFFSLNIKLIPVAVHFWEISRSVSAEKNVMKDIFISVQFAGF